MLKSINPLFPAELIKLLYQLLLSMQSFPKGLAILALQKSSRFRLTTCACTVCSALKPKASNIDVAKPCRRVLWPISQDSKSLPTLLKGGKTLIECSCFCSKDEDLELRSEKADYKHEPISTTKVMRAVISGREMLKIVPVAQPGLHAEVATL